MATVADQLRQAREAQNLTVQQVAEMTKIRTDHVRALDSGSYDSFPAPVYIRGFVRTYAAFLKLDVNKLIDQLNSELGQAGKDQAMPASPQDRERFFNVILFHLWRVRWKIVLPGIALAAVLAIGIYSWRAWSSHKSKDPLAELGSGLYQPAQKADGEMLPLPAPRR